MRQILPAAAIVAAALVTSPVAQAADDLEARAARLAALRAEVTALQEEISGRKDEVDTQLRALDAQRIDLDVQVRREELRLAQLQAALAEVQAKQATDSGLDDQVKPVVLAGIGEVRTAVSGGLPFRVAERLAALDELQAAVERNELAATKALGRLWAFVEDELRLARENAVDRQTVTLDGVEVLGEVARLGMAALLFRAPDGRVGFAVRDGAAWTWRVVEDEADVAAIGGVFESLKKGIRTGAFELPWAFAEVSR